MLENDRDVLLAGRIMAALRKLRLTWLEAFVLIHHYWSGWGLRDVAGMADRDYREIEAARRSLITKAAAALGYLPEPIIPAR